MYGLDVDLDMSDAELVSIGGEGGCGDGENALTLKRMRDLDVDMATAEWRVGDGVVVLYA